MEVCGGMQRYMEVHIGICRSTQRCAEVHKGAWRYAEVCIGYVDVCGGMHRSTCRCA